MRVAPIAAIAFVVLAAGCGVHHGAPNVKGKPFPSALAQLRAHGWLVAVPSFPRRGGRLDDFRVVGQRTTGGRTVTLKVAQPPEQVVVLRLVEANPPPVPRLVGRTYRNASGVARWNAVALSVKHVQPLRPAASTDGIDAFVVVSQRREADDVVAVRLGVRPCWKTVINDWFSDGRLDRGYAPRCYREALRRLPADGAFDLSELLERRLRRRAPS
jgi:hypothetical protein